MYYQLPLERLARHRGSRPQLDFAREALLALHESDDARFEATERGLEMYAAHEEALAQPVAVLHDRFGDLVDIRPPRVRCLPGHPLQQPVMALRVIVRREHALAAAHELRARNARIEEECQRGRTRHHPGAGAAARPPRPGRAARFPLPRHRPACDAAESLW